MPLDGQDDEDHIDTEEGDDYHNNHRSDKDDENDDNLSDQDEKYPPSRDLLNQVKADGNDDEEAPTTSPSAKYQMDSKGKYPPNAAGGSKASDETTNTSATRVQRPPKGTSTLDSLINFLPRSWRREILRWKRRRNVVLDEKYSIDKLQGLMEFHKGTRLSKRVFILLLTPLPWFLSVLGIYAIPLGSLTEGIDGNSLFLLSFWLSGILVTMGFAFSMRDAMRLHRGVPFLRLVGACVLINTLQTILFMLLAFTWRFPVPFFHVMCGGIWILLYYLCLQAILPATKKHELRKFINILVTQSMTYAIFLWLSVLYTRVALSGQLLMTFLLPICKALLKKSFARQTIGLRHGRSEIQLNHVTIFLALYQALNIQHSKGVEAIAGILIVEFVDCMVAMEYDLNRGVSYGVKDMVGASMKIIALWRKTKRKTLIKLKNQDEGDPENQISDETGSSSNTTPTVSALVSPQQESPPTSPLTKETRAQAAAARAQRLRKLSLQAFGLMPSNPSPQKNSKGTPSSTQKPPGITKLPVTSSSPPPKIRAVDSIQLKHTQEEKNENIAQGSPSPTPPQSSRFNSQLSKDDVTLNFDRLDEPLYTHLRPPVSMATSETRLVATVAAVAARSASNTRMAALSSNNRALASLTGISPPRPFLSQAPKNNSFGCLEVERGISLIDKEQVLLVNQTLHMLHATEQLMLRAYFQVVMPILIALYTGICANLPNAKYDRFLMEHAATRSTDSSTGLSLALALCHAASWVVIRFVIRHRYRISCLSQLSFALQSYQLAFGGKLLVSLLFLLSFNLLHYGIDV